MMKTLTFYQNESSLGFSQPASTVLKALPEGPPFAERTLKGQVTYTGLVCSCALSLGHGAHPLPGWPWTFHRTAQPWDQTN